MTKVVLQKEGTYTAVGIIGDTKQEVERRYYSFWNHNGTNGELHWLRDMAKPYVGYFWSDDKRIRKSVKSVTLLEAMQSGISSDFKGAKGGMMSFVNDIVKIKLSEMKSERFIDRKSRYDFYDVGVIRAENLTDYDATK